MWMNEAKDYHGEPIGQGDFSKYGHYSKIPKFHNTVPSCGTQEANGFCTAQCMWKSTKKLGMASAKSAKGGTYIVARYSPPGNWTGQKPY